MQLAAFGAESQYLSGNPQLNFFKIYCIIISILYNLLGSFYLIFKIMTTHYIF